MKLLGFPDYAPQARRLATQLGCDYGEILIHRFPDGESQVTVPTELNNHIVLCRSLDRPNDKLIELLLAVRTLRRHDVQRISLVAPYLCYMRQDRAFHPGEAISQTIIGQLLAELCDDLITVDAHLHRIERLNQAIPLENAINLSATEALGNFLAERWNNPFLLGPDSESEQWVCAMASQRGLDYGVASKTRLGDRSVKIRLPETGFSDRDVVLLDDMASTARTLIETARLLTPLAPRSINALVTHALFTDEAQRQMAVAGIVTIASSDSVSHPSNKMELAALLANAVRRIEKRLRDQ